MTTEVIPAGNPALEKINQLQGQLADNDLAEQLGSGSFSDGRLRGTYMNWEDSDENPPYSVLDVYDAYWGTQTEFKFPPPFDTFSGPVIQELVGGPNDGYSFISLGRIVLRGRAPLVILADGRRRIPLEVISFDITPEAILIGAPEEHSVYTDIAPTGTPQYGTVFGLLIKRSPINLLVPDESQAA